MEALNITFEQMMTLYLEGVIGMIEFREWLAHHSPSFREVRDLDIDTAIREDAALAIEQKRQLLREQEEWSLPPDGDPLGPSL